MSSGHANLRSFVPSVCGSSLSSSIFIFLACILKLISLSSSQLSLFLCNLSQLFLRQNSYDRQSKILRLVCLTLVIFCQGPPHTSRGCEPRRGRQCWRGQSWCQSWWWRRAPEHMDKYFFIGLYWFIFQAYFCHKFVLYFKTFVICPNIPEKF